MSNGRNDYFDIAISVFDMGLAIAKNLKRLSSILKKKRGKIHKATPTVIQTTETLSL